MFRILPIVYVVWRSFFTVTNGIYTFVGIRSYINVITQKLFWLSIFNSILISLFYVSLKYVLVIFIGEWVVRNPNLRKIILRIAYIPTIVGGFVYAIIFRYFLDSNFYLPSWLISSNLIETNLFNQVLVSIILLWTSFGIALTMFVNRRFRMPKELEEFGLIEGASFFERFIHIIFPYTKSVFILIGLLGVVEVFTEIEIIMNLTFGGPEQSTITFGYFNYLVSLQFGNFSQASASTVILTLFIFLIVFWLLKIYEKNNKGI